LCDQCVGEDGGVRHETKRQIIYQGHQRIFTTGTRVSNIIGYTGIDPWYRAPVFAREIAGGAANDSGYRRTTTCEHYAGRKYQDPSSGAKRQFHTLESIESNENAVIDNSLCAIDFFDS
jgi:hypothetical protein